ncbi:hypothetical protein [Methylobacterium sp. WL120]|uniref:hypothetical protein n=1 Tax=Methylobacterium sp. WL120 TaxID=2603887 RepID=UPI0011CBB9DB|nr:hypothetical protein [Methylobacterium sp. WL120]TXM65785.1 hypothetical protein FV229_14490 [Methylobacterium sp. WL120]
MSERLSLRQLAIRLDRDATGLGRLARKGSIPKGEDGKFDLEAVRAALAVNVDPVRQKATVDGLRSTSTRSTVHTRTETGTFPTPAAYRDRAELGDPFARGAMYAAAVVAYGVPTAAASAAIEAGAGRVLALKVYDAAKTDAAFLTGDVTEALGLALGKDDAGPHAPTAFGAFDPSTFPGAAP